MSLLCPYCDYQCARKNVLSRHLNRYHLDKNEKTGIECQTCRKAFYNLESLRRHLKKRNCEPIATNIPEHEIQPIPEPEIQPIQQPEIIYIEDKETIPKYIKKRPLWKWFLVTSVLIIVSRIYRNRELPLKN